MRDTPYFEWTYPEENDDPYDDAITGFFTQLDDGVFGLMNTAANIIIPPSFVGWDQNSLQFSWSSYFEIPLMSVAFSLRVQFGPDGINKIAQMSDGARLVVTVPRTGSQTMDANFQVVTTTTPIVNGLFTVGFCRGMRFFANFPQIF